MLMLTLTGKVKQIVEKDTQLVCVQTEGVLGLRGSCGGVGEPGVAEAI